MDEKQIREIVRRALEENEDFEEAVEDMVKAVIRQVDAADRGDLACVIREANPRFSDTEYIEDLPEAERRQALDDHLEAARQATEDAIVRAILDYLNGLQQ